MVTLASRVSERDDLQTQIQDTLQELGTGRVGGVAYDTAWVSRLSAHYPNQGFEESLEWLRRNQYEDGTWGAPLLHYHDRFISTLAAIVALREVGREVRDQRRIKRGEDALWKLVGRLGRDDSDTVGFPILSTSLAEEAGALGLDVPQAPVRFAEPYKKKVTALLNQPNRNWHATSLPFSLEALRLALQDNDDVLTANHSVGVSPSATAGYLMTRHHEKALDYIRHNIGTDGAVPAVTPIDTFEIAWSQLHLLRARAVDFDHPQVRRTAQQLWQAWSPKSGISFSSYFRPHDIDDTSGCFIVLSQMGYPVDPSVFGSYEQENHFSCFHTETNLSISGHVRLLLALRLYRDEPQCVAWIKKVLKVLQWSDENGSFWWDKWHASPYYVNSTAVIALRGVANDLAASRLKWILRTQNDDGGWGYLGESTPEETAYCLEALLTWDRKQERLNPAALAAAAHYLWKHVNDRHFTPLWIGKSLYAPHVLVKSLILSVLFAYGYHE
jgi:hypothetical protein